MQTITSEPLNFKLKNFTRVMRKRPDFMHQEKLRDLYRHGDLEDRVFATILNGVISSKQPIFMLSRDLVEEMLSKDPNSTRKTICGQEYKDLQEMFNTRFVRIAKWVSIGRKTENVRSSGKSIYEFWHHASVYSLNPDKDAELFKHCLGDLWEIEYEYRKKFVEAVYANLAGFLKKKPPAPLPKRWNFLAEWQEKEKNNTLHLRTAFSPCRIKSIYNIYLYNYTSPWEKNSKVINLGEAEKNVTGGGGSEENPRLEKPEGKYESYPRRDLTHSTERRDPSKITLLDKLILTTPDSSQTLREALDVNWYFKGGTVEQLREFKRKANPAYTAYLLEEVMNRLDALIKGGQPVTPNQQVAIPNPYGKYGLGDDPLAQFCDPIIKEYYAMFYNRFGEKSTEVFYPTHAKQIKNCLEILAGKKQTITQTHVELFLTAVDYALCNWDMLCDNQAFCGKNRTVSRYPNLNNMLAQWRFRIILHHAKQWVAAFSFSMKVSGSKSQWLTTMLRQQMNKPKHKKDAFFQAARKKAQKYGYTLAATQMYAACGTTTDTSFKGMFKRLKTEGISDYPALRVEGRESVDQLLSYCKKTKNYEPTEKEIFEQVVLKKKSQGCPEGMTEDEYQWKMRMVEEGIRRVERENLRIN